MVLVDTYKYFGKFTLIFPDREMDQVANFIEETLADLRSRVIKQV